MTIPVEYIDDTLGFNPEWVVGQISPRPVLFITSDQDRLVPLPLPSLGFLLQSLLVRYPAVQTLARQHSQFYLGHVQPTAVLGRVVDTVAFVWECVTFLPAFGICAKSSVAIEVILYILVPWSWLEEEAINFVRIS